MNLLRQAFPSGSTYRRTLGCAAIVAIAAGALLLFQLGPHRIKVGEDRLLSSALLPGHSKLFVVETRDGNILEPYAVTLYRLDQNSNVFVCFLGNESDRK